MPLLTEPTIHATQTSKKTKKLTVAQALIHYLAVQQTELLDGGIASLFGGIWGIFGHGNVTGIVEALQYFSNTSQIRHNISTSRPCVLETC